MKKQCGSLGVLFICTFFYTASFAQISCTTTDAPMMLKSQSNEVISNSCPHATDKCVGKIIWENGASYEGEIQYNEMNGQGKLTVPNQLTYTGSFVKGMPHGKGKIYYESGSNYDGEWFEGKKEGFGAYYFPCGPEYLGKFKDDKFHGEGVLRINERESIIANWENGLLTGRGTHYLPDGSYFIGNYESGTRNGEGIIVWEKGDTMRGTWQNGSITQESEFQFADGSKIIHYWEEGNLLDKAIYVQPGGLKFTAKPEDLAHLVANSNLGKSDYVGNNFSLAWYYAATEYKSQEKLDGAIEQLQFAQFFQDPFEDTQIANWVNSEIEYLQKEKKKTGVAKKENEDSPNH